MVICWETHRLAAKATHMVTLESGRRHALCATHLRRFRALGMVVEARPLTPAENEDVE